MAEVCWPPVSAHATATFRDEVVGLCQALVRLNTVNGNETPAAELLRAYLEQNGVEVELYAHDPARANLVARLRGRGDGPSLAFLSHTDTVVADASEWEHDPWCGDVVDGEVWGRGALDMKSQVAASAVAIASLAREGFVPAGDVLFVAAADEESNFTPEPVGLEWLVQAHPDAVRADCSLNEGGYGRLPLADGRVFYLAAAAEKRTTPFRLRFRGRAGHAAIAFRADSALVKVAEAALALAAYAPEPELIPEVAAFLEAVCGSVPPVGNALEAAREVDPAAAVMIEALLSPTVSPTMITASQKRNVIPALTEVTVDCRLLPGQTQAGVEPMLRAWLGEGDYELVWREGQGGTRSAMDTPLWAAAEAFIAEVEPGARVAPICVAGFTDSHWLREAFGTVAYGFFPVKSMDPDLAARLVHSADERADVDDLELGVRFLRHAAQAIGTTG
jgi:acetylornithine deacetylase/succinyl-diaminopimelate desuccinylase-like protein